MAERCRGTRTGLTPETPGYRKQTYTRPASPAHRAGRAPRHRQLITRTFTVSRRLSDRPAKKLGTVRHVYFLHGRPVCRSARLGLLHQTRAPR